MKRDTALKISGLAAAIPLLLWLTKLSSRKKKLLFGSDETTVKLDEKYGLWMMDVHGVPYPPFITEATVDLLQKRFTPRPSDVFVVTSPKCGTTWMQQIVLLLNHGAQRVNVFQQAGWIERKVCDGSITLEELLPTSTTAPDRLTIAGGGRRVFKTHAPFQLFPCSDLGKSKVIYVARNVKDACVSAYYQTYAFKFLRYEGTWDHFARCMYLKGLTGSGSWFDHVAGWWKAHIEKPKQILWVTYEDLRAKPEVTISRVADFLEIPYDDSLIQATINASSLSKMRNDYTSLGHVRRAVFGEKVGFFHRGRVGSWREKFTVEQSDLYDRSIKKKLGELAGGFRVDFGDGDVFKPHGSKGARHV